EAMGAVNILPQLLASLGVIFTLAGVGNLIAQGIQQIIPANNLFLLVLANCLGMALFTIVMGNSFAAFPVIATGVLVPLIVKPFGVNPAMAAIITLTAGSSGTLMTPMAANFNIVPAALLNMRDQYGVIKFQFPYALTLWSFHVVLLWLLIKISLDKSNTIEGNNERELSSHSFQRCVRGADRRFDTPDGFSTASGSGRVN